MQTKKLSNIVQNSRVCLMCDLYQKSVSRSITYRIVGNQEIVEADFFSLTISFFAQLIAFPIREASPC